MIVLSVKSQLQIHQKNYQSYQFQGRIIWDQTKPDGTSHKILDKTLIKKVEREANTNLDDGIRETILICKNEFPELNC